MNKLKKALPIIIIVLFVGLIYSFFHISGWEIRNISSLTDAKSVSVIISDTSSDERVEYELNKKQVVELYTLLKNNSYSRRISSTIVGFLPEKEYRIFANWDDMGQKHLHVTVLGGEYIQFLGQFGSHYHKISNPDFEKELNSILD